ncbi:MAG: helix-turn-helix domain-containing protein [Pyrinomonadaceae bacterium]
MLWQEYLINDEFSPLAVQGIFLQLMAALMREKRSMSIKSPTWVAKIKELIREQYTGRVSLEALSAKLNIHPVYLSREFPKYFHCSLSEYFRRIKIKEAIGLMSDETRSLTDIAHKCGFSDQSHFSRTFKKMHNLTPSEYRQKIVSR